MKKEKFVGLRIVKNSNENVIINDARWRSMLNKAQSAGRTWYLDRYGKVLFTLNIRGQVVDILPVAWVNKQSMDYREMMQLGIARADWKSLPIYHKTDMIFGEGEGRISLCTDTWKEQACYLYSFKDEKHKLVTRQFTCEPSDDAEFGRYVKARMKMASDMHPFSSTLSAILLERADDSIFEHPSGIRINPVYIGYATVEE